jgi:hypothetical protein
MLGNTLAGTLTIGLAINEQTLAAVKRMLSDEGF